MIKRNLVSVLMGTLAATVVAAEAHAQAVPPRGETVETRPRPEVDALGVRVRSFLFFPSIEVEEEYNDNVFATEKDTEDDFITRIKPELNVESDWSRHFLGFSTGADSGFHAHNQNEDYTDWFADTRGRIDIARESSVTIGGGYARLHQDRGDPDDVRATRNPTEFDRYRAFAIYDQGFGAFGTELTGTFVRTNFEDEGTSANIGGVPFTVNNDDRDRNTYDAQLRASYEILPPDYEAFIQFGGNIREYDQTPDDAVGAAPGVDRDSSGWNVGTGVSLDLGGIVFGEISVGYFDQSYDNDNNLDDIDGFTYGLGVDWNVTPLTTLNFFGSREVRETTQRDVDGDAASGYLRSTAGLGVDHELLRTLILSSEFSYYNDDYEGISRDDDNFEFGLGARYFLNRYLYANASYGLRRRLSDTDGDGTAGSDDFLENIFRISLEAQL